MGDYELLRRIDVGGMGVVYQARQISLNRMVAVKMILAGVWATPNAVARFRAEAEAAARLEHPNIVGIYEVGEYEGQHYFSMEYVEGDDLARRVQQGPLSARESASHVQCIARAIQYAHDRGILHRDLKPSNILLEAGRVPRITDFGLAKQIEGDAGMTRSGQIIGTPSYMSPEQAKGDVRAQACPADIYSLGAILYHLLAGRAPFAAATLQETLTQVMESEPVSPRMINPAVPRDLETICLKCLEKDPARRYRSAADLADDLERWLRDEPIRARAASSAERAIKWVRRKPVWAAFWGAIVSAAVTVGSVILVKNAEIGRQHHTATNALAELRTSERATRANRYAGDLYYISRAVQQGNVAAAAALLDAQIPVGEQEDLRGFEWRYWRHRIRDTSLRVLARHRGMVTAVAFSPDGKWLASADDAGEICLWEVSDPRPSRWRLAEAETSAMSPPAEAPVRRGVLSLAFSPGSEVLAVARADGAVACWEIFGRRWVAVNVEGRQLTFGGEGQRLAIAGGDEIARGRVGSVTIYDRREGRVIRSEEKAGGSLAASRDGRWLVSAGHGGRVRLWTNGLERAGEWTEEKGVSLVAISADGAVVATANQFDRDVRLMGTRKLARFGQLQGHSAAITGIAFAPGMAQVVTTSEDGTVRFWEGSHREVADMRLTAGLAPGNAHVGKELARYYGHSNEVTSVAYSSNGLFIATGGKDRTVRIWRGRALSEMTVKTNVALPLVFSAIAPWMAARDRAGGLLFGQELYGLRAARPPLAEVIPVFFSDDGQHLAVLSRGSAEGPIMLELRSTNRLTVVKKTVLMESAAMAFDGEVLSAGGRVILGDGAGRAGVWEALNGRREAWLEGWPRGRIRAAITSDARRLAVAVTGGTNPVVIYALPEGRVDATIALPGTGSVLDLVVSPDGSTLIFSADDKFIRFLDMPGGRERVAILRPGEPVVRLAISPDGRTLATAARDGAVQLWSIGTRRELCELERGMGTSIPAALTFAPDGRSLCLLDEAGRLRWWAAPREETGEKK